MQDAYLPCTFSDSRGETEIKRRARLWSSMRQKGLQSAFRNGGEEKPSLHAVLNRRTRQKSFSKFQGPFFRNRFFFSSSSSHPNTRNRCFLGGRFDLNPELSAMQSRNSIVARVAAAAALDGEREQRKGFCRVAHANSIRRGREYKLGTCTST